MIDHLSASQIQTYMECSLKYKFNKIDQLPKPFKPAGLALGSSIHAAVEWLHRRWKQGDEVTLKSVWDIFEADWYAQSLDEIRYKNGDTSEESVELGKSLLSVYFNNSAHNGILHAELPFDVPLVDTQTNETLGISLQGMFDRIETGDIVADLKTWSRTLSQDDLASNIQLTAYSYAYRMLFKTIPTLRFDVLLKTRIPQFKQFFSLRTDADHQSFFLLCKEVYNGIRKEVFFPTPSWKCRDCEYRQHCWFWRGKA